VAYYVVVSIFMRMARKPADNEHPYGHSQLESIAALIVGAFVVATAVTIFWDAVNNVYEQWIGERAALPSSPWALYIALLTVGAKLVLLWVTRRIGQQTENPAILALAYDHRNDIFSASGAALGIFVGRIGLPWVDPLAGALVALIILRTGVEIVRQSSEELMDAVPSEALSHQIEQVMKEIPEVLSIEEIHSHRFGPYLVVNITIGVDGRISVADGDCIASEVEALLYQRIELLRRVHIHYHPVHGDPPDQPVFMRTLE
jgi:cation diffusion facilitator family transporter